MIYELTTLFVIVFQLTIVPYAFLALSIVGIRRSRKVGKILWGALGVVSCLPIGAVVFLLGWLVLANAPFTSGVIAYSSAPDGDEACIVQASAIIEYRVSLYARHRGRPWSWNYLAHDDVRWRNCQIEFAGDQMRVYRGGRLAKNSFGFGGDRPKNIRAFNAG